MSISVVVKVNDGVVLATDSASSLMISDDQGHLNVANVYNNADKVFNLAKGYPIAMCSWGNGGIGGSSISKLTKDLRCRLCDESDSDWFLGNEYSIGKVAGLVRKFFYEDHYIPFYKDAKGKPDILFFIAGYSSEAAYPEVWEVKIGKGESPDPKMLRDENAVGINWGGELEAINRLVKGLGVKMREALAELKVPDEQIDPAIQHFERKLERPLVVEAMPIQDAIDLAHFLVATTIEFVRFNPGAPTVGGPIDIAAITKHEKFKWIKRKHYYDQDLNP